MTEFQELVKNAPKFASMECGELVAYAYAMYAAGVKTDAENAKLRELMKDIDEVADPFLWEFIGRRMRELGIEVDG